MSTNPATKNIEQLLKHVDENELVLPEIQREFVWKRRSIQLLFDSLYRGMPIGHMLVWKASKTVQAKRFAGQRRTPGQYLNNFYGYLLDGQQRITALMRVRDGDDDYPLVFELWPEDDDGELFYWRSTWNDGDPWYPSVAEVLSSKFNILDYIDKLKSDPYFKTEHADHVLKSLGRLQQIMQYQVGITEYETDKYRDATELFVRFNSTGRRLNTNDLAAAELALHVPGLLSESLSKGTQMWDKFTFTMPFLVQCLLAVLTGRMQLKNTAALWSQYEDKEIRGAWERTQRGISEVLGILTGTVRWDSAAWVPSFNALVPLIVLMAYGRAPSASERELARRWLILATVHRYFSASAYTELDQLLRRMDRKRGVSHLWSLTKRRLRRVRPNHFETSRVSGPTMSMYISMLRDRDARDWKTKVPLDGSVVGRNVSLNIHHFFPRSLLRKHGYAADEINTFANYTVLSVAGNLDVGTEEPSTYMKRLNISTRDLHAQCIPADTRLWHVDRYEEFLTTRRKLLAENVNEFLGV